MVAAIGRRIFFWFFLAGQLGAFVSVGVGLSLTY
jgi:hypothetical protein